MKHRQFLAQQSTYPPDTEMMLLGTRLETRVIVEDGGAGGPGHPSQSALPQIFSLGSQLLSHVPATLRFLAVSAHEDFLQDCTFISLPLFEAP